MLEPKALLQASFDASKAFFRPPGQATTAANEDHASRRAEQTRSPVMVPIRSIGQQELGRITQHLLALNERDRYLRFGYAASDDQIARYTQGLDFERDEIYGIYNRKLELIAMAHLAFAYESQCASCAEFGVSVLPHARGRGYGGRLFERAVMHASNEGVSMMFIHALSENTAMLKIARNAGATLERDGSETEAYLRLASPTLDTRMTEIVEDRFAQLDYHMKVQAQHFWSFLAGVQEVRRGVQAARHHRRM
ncbi:MAG: GNAT family N-acetyltransferase [Burkholderiaceae bacterium]